MPYRLYLSATKPRPPSLAPNAAKRLISIGTVAGLQVGVLLLSVSGVAMLLMAGEPLPLFIGSVPNPQPFGINKEAAKSIRDVHKTFGIIWSVLVPLHIAGAAAHVAQGEKILQRMNPFI